MMFGKQSPVRPVCSYCAQHGVPGAMVKIGTGWMCQVCGSTLTVKEKAG